MGKTHEALERAEKEHQENILGPSLQTPPTHVPPPPRRASTPAAVERYDDLKTNLLTRQANGPVRTILFTGTTQGDGCSTTAVNFAAALAKDPKVKVLLVEVNLRTPSLHDVFKIDHTQGVSELISGDGEIASKINKVKPGNLYVLPCGGNHSDPLCLFESTRFDQLLELMSKKFDYIILDGPPVPAFSECKVLCTKVDGVVLVLESGKTRRQVALRAKMQVEEAGGKVLGVVLNKRKHHIPDWLYRRL